MFMLMLMFGSIEPKWLLWFIDYVLYIKDWYL